MVAVRLKVLGGKHQGKLIPLPVGKFLVGRERDCHLRPASESVSRHHCVFHVDQFAVRLRDLGSRNGTQINGEPMHGEMTLRDGDRIRIGSLEFQAVLSDVTQEPATVAAGPVFVDTAVMSSAETHYELPAMPPPNGPEPHRPTVAPARSSTPSERSGV